MGIKKILNNIFYFLVLSLISILILFFSQSPFILCIRLIALVTRIRVFLHGCKSLWFTYSLIIIFLGGMIVVFSYASSMHRVFKLNLKINKLLIIFSLLIGIIIFRYFEGLSMIKVIGISSTVINYKLSGGFLLSFIAFLLLITLFLVSKLVRLEEGPLKL